jgi:hypothetical protein
MKIGDKVRIVTGKGKGHTGVIVGFRGQAVTVRSSTLGIGDGLGQEYDVPRAAVEPAPYAGAAAPRTAAPWRPYSPPSFRPPREGSDRASRLPSIMGGMPVVPPVARS